MAAEISSARLNPVRQFSIFTENRVGRLHDLTSLFKGNNVHLMAVTVLDTADSSIVRVIVDDPERARELMVNNDFPYTETIVLAVEVAEESEIERVLAALLEAEINIHYIYSFLKRPLGMGAVAVSVEDVETAGQALNRRGLRVLSQSDLSR